MRMNSPRRAGALEEKGMKNKRILCFGDSNTWGWMPLKATRYPDDVRWTGVMAAELGEGYTVIEDGISGRLTATDDPYHPYFNGRTALPYSLLSSYPLDLVILFLGTNDIKYTEPYRAANGIEALISDVRNATVRFDSYSPMYEGEPKILVVLPTAIGPDIARVNPTSDLRWAYERSLELGPAIRKMADLYGVETLNAADFAAPSETDAVHFTAEGHHALGVAMARKVREMLG